MKYGWLLICIGFALQAQAQLGKWAKLPLQKGAVVRHVHLPKAAVEVPVHHSVAHQLMRPAPQVKIPSALHGVNASLRKQYRETWAQFQQFKKDSAPFLYYQTIPIERHALSAAEKHYWLDQITPLYERIRALQTHLAQDAPLQEAAHYVGTLLSVVSQSLLHTLQISPLDPKAQAAATPDISTFCLYPTPDMQLPDPSILLEGKHIAIINDDTSILDDLERFAHFGVLLPGATLSTHGDASQFLLWMQSTPQPPELIFTDIQLGTETGYYLVYQLRQQGYTGGIIALTSYAEEESSVHSLSARGLNGLVSLQQSPLLKDMHIAQRITQAAQIYFLRHNPAK